MKLYYDMLIPYMPDAVQDENGELVQNDQKIAGRRAMSELANFQNNGNVISLYQSVIYACTYAGVDLVDTILSIPEDIDFEPGVTVIATIDDAAKLLFKSIKPGESFDIHRYVANILMAVHAILSNQETETELPFSNSEE